MPFHARRWAPMVLFGSLVCAVPSAAATRVGGPLRAGAHETTLYAFHGAHPARPYSGLTADRHGALFGTTAGGGPIDLGMIFKLTPGTTGYTKSILYRFQAKDGAHPYAGLVAGNDGAFYGTTFNGGGTFCRQGCGTVFKLTPTRTGYAHSVLHRFRGRRDGANPEGSLMIDSQGALYGTTSAGGGAAWCEGGCGTVFKLTPSGPGYVERILYAFKGSYDGFNATGGLVADREGRLYGTTGGGFTPCSPNGPCGTVYKLTPAGSGYTELVLYRFAGSTDGAHPWAGVIVDRDGVLYGTASAGGGSHCSGGCGNVFRLTPTGGGYTPGVAYIFQGGNDGRDPLAGLIADKHGSLFSTTAYGGGSTDNGTVFKLTPTGRTYSETILYSFHRLNDGATPYSSLIADDRGALYGTASQGGDPICSGGCGTVFKVTQ
jgi:uncharacterized repeat protein (TIGR03803 family)